MTSRRILALFLFILVLVFSAAAQTVSDSDPVLQGSATYSMPQSAIDADIDGNVVMNVQVDEAGNPTKAELVSGPRWPCVPAPPKTALQELSANLTETMLKLRFSPAMKKGKPVAKEVAIKLALKNPKMDLKPQIDPTTGEVMPTHLSSGLLNARAIFMPKPSFPEGLAKALSGSVALSVLVDEQGKVIRAGPFSGPAALQSYARDAACSSRFTPVQLSGRPIKVTGVISYSIPK